MEWNDALAGLGGDAFWTALRAALGGVLLLLLLRPLIARHLTTWPWRRHEPGSESEAGVENPSGRAVLHRVRAAYERNNAQDGPQEDSSSEALLPIKGERNDSFAICPPELSRRIDRIEAKVRARSAGSRG